MVFSEKVIWKVALQVFVLVNMLAVSSCRKTGGNADGIPVPAATPGWQAVFRNNTASLPLNMAFDIFTTEQGLCSNTVTQLFQDSKGFLWIGTDGGLNRFDGYEFRRFQHDENDPLSLPDNNIFGVNEDSQGIIWALTPNGLWEFDPLSGKSAVWQDSMITKQITAIIKEVTLDRHDRIWLPCNDSLTYFDIPHRKYVRLPQPGGMVYEKPDGTLAAFCYTRLNADTLLRHSVILCQAGETTFETLLDTVYSTNYAPTNRGLAFNAGNFDGQGNLWAGRQDGYLQKFDFHTRQWSFLFIPPRERPWHFGTVFHVSPAGDGQSLWMGGYGGLFCLSLNPDTQPRFRQWRHDDSDPASLPVIVVLRVLEDRSGNVWVGTYGGGLCRYSPTRRRFEAFVQQQCDTAGLPDKKIESVLFDRMGRLWAGTAKGLSLLNDRQRKHFKTFRRDISQTHVSANNDWVRAVAEDTASGKLLLGYWGDLPSAFDPETERFLPLEISNFDAATWEKFRNPYISSISPDGKGSFFFAHWGGWMYQYETASRKFTTHSWGTTEEALKAGVLTGLVSIAYPDRNGVLWMGSDENKGGLVAIDQSKNKSPRLFDNNDRPFQAPDPQALRIYLPGTEDSTRLPTAHIKTILEDKKGRLWLGTAAGLSWMKDRQAGVFQTFSANAGLPDPFVLSMAEDDRGRLWLGTNNGLCCFDPETGRVLATFDVNDGLPANQFSPNACSKSKTGALAFGTSAGICIFHPDSLPFNPAIPPVEITAFEVNGAPTPHPEGPVRLAHFEKNIKIRFAALDLSDPGQNRYQYFLEGFEDGWSQPAATREAGYTNLPPGKYIFRARGSNNDGIWNMEGASLTFVIARPWWQTWWARMAAGASIAGLIFWLVRSRERKMRRRQAENERLIKYLQVQTLQAQINPHFIFNVLGAMQNQILNANPQEANRHLVNLSKLIRRFLDSSIGSAMPGKGLSQHEIPLEQELELLTMYIEFEQLQRQGRFTSEIQVDENLNIANRTIPPMIIQPYVENAIKHGLLYLEQGEREGKLTLRFKKTKDALLVTVEDNGVGRQRAADIQQHSRQIYKSHGTRLVGERVAILNGMGYDIAIEINDRTGGGTIVTIKIKD